MAQAETRGEATSWIYSSLRGEADFAEILPFFVDELPEKRGILQGLAEAFDFDNLQREAHKLRGSAGGYGFQEVSDLAGRLEDSCKIPMRDRSSILQNLDELLDHLERVRV